MIPVDRGHRPTIIGKIESTRSRNIGKPFTADI